MEGLSNEEAMQRMRNGGALLCLDVPINTDFGVNSRSFKTGEKFRGVKMIPPGLNFVHYMAGEAHAASAAGIRSGFFMRAAPGCVEVKKWDAAEEDFYSADAVSADERDRLTNAVLQLQFDAFLAPYSADDHGLWTSLTDHVTPSVLERCGIPVGTHVWPGNAEDDEAVAAISGDTQVVPFFPGLARVPKFTTLLDRKAAGALTGADALTGAELTKFNLDKTRAVLHMVKVDCAGDYKELIGEMQLAFVLFFHLSSLAALEQWKVLVHALCCCDDAITSHPALMETFLETLRPQLEQAPADFFVADNELSGNNFLKPSLKILLEVLDATEGLNPRLSRTAAKFFGFVQHRFGWDVRSGREESDEDLPVVVMEDELGGAGGGVEEADAQPDTEANGNEGTRDSTGNWNLLF